MPTDNDDERRRKLREEMLRQEEERLSRGGGSGATGGRRAMMERQETPNSESLGRDVQHPLFSFDPEASIKGTAKRDRSFGEDQRRRFERGREDVRGSRNRFMETLEGGSAIGPAQEAREFLGESARGLAAELMPELNRGLRATRSRFGGAIRSGGAQEAEERAFERLFADPLQNRIAQLSARALSSGELERGRQIQGASSLANLDLQRAGLDLGASEGALNRFYSAIGGRAERDLQRDIEEERRKGSFLEGLGSGIGSLASLAFI